MNAVDLIRRLHQHRLWANAKLRAVALTLAPEQLHQKFEMGRGSVWSTLVHMYSAEFVWLEALNGNANHPLFGDDAFASIEELQIAWAALDIRWQRYLADLTEKRLDLPVHRRTMVTPASDVLLHVCTHAHYTTAQCINMFRRLGVPPENLPDPQVILLSRQENNA